MTKQTQSKNGIQNGATGGWGEGHWIYPTDMKLIASHQCDKACTDHSIPTATMTGTGRTFNITFVFYFICILRQLGVGKPFKSF